MIISITILLILGFVLGLVLGVASIFLKIEQDPIENEILQILVGSNCGHCGFVGCSQAAKALIEGKASPTLCIPGGKSVAEKLAKRLNLSLDMKEVKESEPVLSFIDESKCIGCTKCSSVCSTDAIVGAPKHIHAVIKDNCHGCRKCEEVCPTMAISMCPIRPTIETWHWAKPKLKCHRKTKKSR